LVEEVNGPRNLRTLRVGVAIVALSAVAFHACAFVVQTGTCALVTRFGRPLDIVAEAGLHAKLPWPVDEVAVLDIRRRVYETGHTEMLTRDKKNVIVRAFAVWHILDPLVFYQSIGSVSGAEQKLDGLLTNGAIGTLGRYDLAAMVSTVPENLRVEDIERDLLAAAAPLAAKTYGIAIDQIRFERLSLPEENVNSVFDQMRAERKQFAAKFRADGEKEASRIRSEADLEAAKIRADGAEQEARIRGESAAEVAHTYANAHRADPTLYRFTRSLESIDKLVGSTTSLVLRTDSAPFSLLQDEATPK
jgi:membrane protease subunit HflC